MARKRITELSKNTFITLAGTIGSRIVLMLMLPFITNQLSVKDFGISESITNLIPMLNVLFSCFMSGAVFRFALPDINDVDRKRFFSTGLACFTISCALFAIIALVVPNLMGIQNYINVSIMLYIVTGFNQLIRSFVRARKQFFLFIFTDILFSIFLFGASYFALAELKGGLVEFLYARVLAILLPVFIIIFFGNLKGEFSLRFIKGTYLKEMFKYALPLMIVDTLWWGVDNIGRYILLAFGQFNASGYFAAGVRITQPIWLILLSFQTAWSVSATEHYLSPARDKFFSDVFNAYLMISSLLILGMNIIAKPLVSVFLAADMKDALKVIILVTPYTIIKGLALFIYVGYTINKQVNRGVLGIVAGTCISTVITTLTANTISLYSAPLGMIVGALVILLFWWLDTRKKYFIIRLHPLRHGFTVILVIIGCVAIMIANIVYGILLNVILAILLLLIWHKEVRSIVSLAYTLIARRNITSAIE